MSREIVPVSVNTITEKEIWDKLNDVSNRSDYIKKLILNDIYKDNKIYNILERLVSAIENKDLSAEQSIIKKEEINTKAANEENKLKEDFLSQF